MTAVRIDSKGELQILHPETGAYVPASVLLQVEGGVLTALIPEQVALLSDIRTASAYLQLIDNTLNAVKAELILNSDKLEASNSQLTLLGSIESALAVIKDSIDSLESLESAANVLLTTLHSDIASMSGKLPVSLGAKIRDNSLSVALATDSTIFASLTSLLLALSDGGADSVYTTLSALSTKLPVSLGAKIRDNSLSVALATDSTIFASLTNLLNALSDGGNNSVFSILNTLSAKLPASLGAKIRDSSLSVTLATDSTIFTLLTNILASLTAGSINSVYSALVALSAKLPLSLGAKLRAESMSVALATDSTIFTSLTSILNALSDGGTNSILSYLKTVAEAQFWKLAVKINGSSPLVNAVTTVTSGAVVYAISPQTKELSFQTFFSTTGTSAKFMIELRLVAASSSLSDRTYYYAGDIATSWNAGAFPGERPVVVPTHGHVGLVFHVLSVTGGGNVTVYAKEIQ